MHHSCFCWFHTRKSETLQSDFKEDYYFEDRTVFLFVYYQFIILCGGEQKQFKCRKLRTKPSAQNDAVAKATPQIQIFGSGPVSREGSSSRQASASEAAATNAISCSTCLHQRPPRNPWSWPADAAGSWLSRLIISRLL